MANIKISQLPSKGANLEATDLVEISEFNGSGYVSKSITGQEIIDAASGGSGVTDVTATSPIVSTGGATPDISITQSGAATDGYLSTGDWNAFNNKQAPLVSGVNIKTINSTSVLGSGDITISGGGGVHAMTQPISGLYLSGQITNGGGASNQSTAVNRMTLYPFIPKNTFTASNFSINCTTNLGGSLCKILIYNDVNGYPNTRLYLSTDLDCSTTGIKTATASSFVFNANTIYWIGTIHNQAGALFTGYALASLLPIGFSTPGTGQNYFFATTNFNYLVPPLGPISPTAFTPNNANLPGVFIQAL